MAAEITIRENGKAEFCFTGPRNQIWHGLGSELQENQSIEVWQIAAGLDWEVLESPITYNAEGHRKVFTDKKALYRGDTFAPLSIASDSYKVVQPTEILEFFRDLVENNGMKLSAAGSLFGGKKFWATAEIGKSAEIVSGDVVDGYLLLTTSVDGTLATTAKMTSTRSICANTINIALKGAGDVVKVNHKSIFDASQVKIDLGMIDTGWNTFITNLRKLSEAPVSGSFARDFVFDLMKNKNILDSEQSNSVESATREIITMFQSGIGNNGTTAWDLLNGITQYHTHSMGRTRSPDALFWNNFYGNQANKKSEAYSKLLALV